MRRIKEEHDAQQAKEHDRMIAEAVAEAEPVLTAEIEKLLARVNELESIAVTAMASCNDAMNRHQTEYAKIGLDREQAFAERERVLADREKHLAEQEMVLAKKNFVCSQAELQLEYQEAEHERQLTEQAAQYERQLAEQEAEHERQLTEQAAQYERQLAEQAAQYEHQLAEQAAQYEHQRALQRQRGLDELETALEAAESPVISPDESDEVAKLKRAIAELREQNEQLFMQWTDSETKLASTRELLEQAISAQQPHGHEDGGSTDHTDEPQPDRNLNRPPPAISAEDLKSATMALAAMPDNGRVSPGLPHTPTDVWTWHPNH